MAKIKLNEKVESVEEGQSPRKTFEDLGVHFSCSAGVCGTCKIKVVSGGDKINKKTEQEENFPLKEGERLACQCHEITGDIEIKNEGF